MVVSAFGEQDPLLTAIESFIATRAQSFSRVGMYCSAIAATFAPRTGHHLGLPKDWAFRKSGAAWLRARAIGSHAGTCTHHIMSAATEIEYSRTHALSKVRAMTCPSIQATSWPHAYARHPADL